MNASARWRYGWITLIIVATAAIMLAILALRHDPASTSARLANAQFVGRHTCIDCHQKQNEDWTGSDHDLAMIVADDSSVLGDFDNARFTHFGHTSHFYKRDGQFFVRTQGPDGQTTEYLVKYTFGHDPLQQYLIEFPGGRLQCLTIAWDTHGKRWYHLYPDEHIAHDDPLHWSKRLQNWNYMCADCHSTNLRRNYDVNTDTFDTTWSEINVSCEACHGPASEHLKWAQSSALKRWFTSGSNYGLTVNFKDTDNATQVHACAPCHSRRHTISSDFVHTAPYFDHYLPELLREGLYFPDGQILDEVYVFGSFTQSKMYHKGVRCTDCHDPHTAKVYVPGNDLCNRCHVPAKYDSPEHHFHPIASAGSQCVECHMPQRTYMGVDPRRDHSFRIPRPDLSVKHGVPNACNMCHDNQSPQWAADHVNAWFGPDRPGPEDHTDAFAAGRQRSPEAEPLLIGIAADPERPALIRGTALLLLREYDSPASLQATQEALADPHPLVRATAVAFYDRLPPAMRLAPLAPLLNDPTRAVRIEVARVLAPVPRDSMPPRQAKAFDAALNEYIQAQMAVADQPGAHLNLGVMHHNLGRIDRAEAAYRQALKLDDQFVQGKINLAGILNQQGRNAEAEKLLRESLALYPRLGEAHYSLGLLLAEEAARRPQAMLEAAEHLLFAAHEMPDHPRVQYNAALALQRLGRADEAEQRFLQALRIDPGSVDILYALGIFYAQRHQWDRAYTYIEQVVQRVPDNAEARQLLNQIRQAMLRGPAR